MKLTLLEGPHAYDVSGLPAGEHAKIACFNDAWRFLRWNDQWHGNWTGKYQTPQDALYALREELLSTTV